MTNELMNTLKFLERVDLKGTEVPMFVQCINLLNDLIRKEKEEIEKVDTSKKS